MMIQQVPRRSLRRHHRERLRKKRSHYNVAWAGDERTLGIVAETPVRCSCTMCGNPRRHFGQPTRQERPRRFERLRLADIVAEETAVLPDDFTAEIESGRLCFDEGEEAELLRYFRP